MNTYYLTEKFCCDERLNLTKRFTQSILQHDGTWKYIQGNKLRFIDILDNGIINGVSIKLKY